jgi:surface carbohydrate biosynthesis protein
VRELDPKLLLACIAAQRGFSSIIGSRREMHFHIASFPRSIYISKSITSASDMMFGIMHKLGHKIVAWDEEALVHLPPEIYFSRRLSSSAMRHVSYLFAWGNDNADLWRQYPELPTGTLIHVTGNPRGDLLRPEVCGYYERKAKEHYKEYGDFILVNTNFNHVNAFSPVQNLFQPVAKPGKEPEFGRAARGMTREYAEGLQDHKQAVFEDFKQLIPALEKAFPDYTVIVRPHPTENPDVYHKIAEHCERVRVTNEGNVVPWLLATRALVHNGCTTGAEAYALRVPSISYRKTVNEYYDYGFYRLPNKLSYECFDFEELCTTLGKILAGDLGAANGIEREALSERYLTAQVGSLACERIVTVLEGMVEKEMDEPKRAIYSRFQARVWAAGRRLVKRYKSSRPDSHNKPEFQRHRYPEISLEEIRARTKRFQDVLGHKQDLRVEQLANQFFLLSQ